MKNNTGFIKELPKIEDYIAGEATGIDYFVRVPSNNWTPWLPKEEKQKKKQREDTKSCVTFSGLNCIETQLNWMIDRGIIEIEAMNFLYQNGYIVDGKVNFSDRYNAILSGTTDKGNYLTKVAKSFRRDGLIPESMLPYPEGITFEEYHGAEITDEMKEMGKKFLEHFAVQYEWVKFPQSKDGNIKENMRQAPLWIAAGVCPGWSTKDIIPACNRSSGHATMLFNVADEQYYEDFDHYNPFKKKLAIDYKLSFIMKVLITAREEYTQPMIAQAKKYALELKDSHTAYFFRPEKNGEAYKIEIDGSVKYLLGKQCPLFDELIRDKIIFGLSEKDFEKLKASLIK